MKSRLAAILAVTVFGLASPLCAQTLPWMNPTLPPDQRAALLVSSMNLTQKYEQLHGQPGVVPELPQCSGIRHVPGLPELQIPTFRITNGPVGIGQSDCSPTPQATAFPAALAVAASFDPAVASNFGAMLGIEANNIGLQLVEAPGENLAREPQGGRNFEYLGEDPLLSGRMAAAEILAIQHQGVLAMAKHYVANDQEVNRMSVNELIDDRVLHELYLIPFEMSVKDGQVASVMCSYNSVNNAHMCQNAPLITTVLRNQWGFSGFVQSDFGAVYSSLALSAGTDLEMFQGKYFLQTAIAPYLATGQITQSMIDTALQRRFTQLFRFGVFDRPIALTPVNFVADGKVARSIGDQTLVLLKNANSTLPLDPATVGSIAIIGQAPYATKAVAGCCGGSSDVASNYVVLPQQGMQDVLTTLGSSATVSLTVVNNDNSNLAAAVTAAQSANVVVIMAGAITEEGSDRTGISLPNNQDALITAVAAANPRTVVVLKDGDAVTMPWLSQIPALVEAWFPGQEDGHIVADILFGVVNPSGKLPITYPPSATQLPTSTAQQYPGVTVNGVPTITYSEGLQMGYRWFDANNVQPQFPFGFGLSYTTFTISSLNVQPSPANDRTPVTVQFVVTNTGQVAGAEVAQVYLGLPPESGEPPKRLVGFQKVFLNPGQSQTVQVTIDPNASNHPLSVWDSGAQSWVVLGGSYQVSVGNSAANLEATSSMTVQHIFGRR